MAEKEKKESERTESFKNYNWKQLNFVAMSWQNFIYKTYSGIVWLANIISRKKFVTLFCENVWKADQKKISIHICLTSYLCHSSCLVWINTFQPKSISSHVASDFLLVSLMFLECC